MRIYLDEDIASAFLTQLLRRAGHDVFLPADLSLSGEPDAVVLRNIIREDRVLLSRNYRDFENLHLLLLEAQGQHKGILVERFDDDPKHNMPPSATLKPRGFPVQRVSDSEPVAVIRKGVKQEKGDRSFIDPESP